MHRALALPEIVYEILRLFHEPDRPSLTLMRCRRVNRTFNFEANRLLWGSCGYLDTWPAIRHLVALAADDFERAQYFAGFVHWLHLNDGERAWIQPSWWDRTFKTLKLPNLRNLTFEGSPDDWISNPEAALMPPPLANLTDLCLSLHNPTDASLDCISQLAKQCPTLKSVQLSCFEGSRPNSLSEDAVAAFIDTVPMLKSVYLDRSFTSIWNSKLVFDSLARHGQLESVWIRRPAVEWLHPLKRFATQRIYFAGVTDLVLGEANQDLLELLLPHLLTRLQHLNILSWIGERNVLTQLSQLRQLRRLQLAFSSNWSMRLASSDLVMLARSCPYLETLVIPNYSGPFGSHYPSGEGVKDETIREMAKSLPRLTEFGLALRDADNLTEESLIWLGRYCKELKRCTLRGLIDFEILVEKIDEYEEGVVLFPQLQTLRIYQSLQAEFEYQVDKTLADRFLAQVPKLEAWYVSGGSKSDRRFHDLVYEALPVIEN